MARFGRLPSFPRGLPALLLGVLLCILLAPLPAPASSPPLLRVAVTLFPLAQFCEAVGGDAVEVFQLLPPGAEPHTWEPRPGDVIRLNRAQLLVHLAQAAEPWVERFAPTAREAGVRLLPLAPGLSPGQDPHVWLDLDRAAAMVESLAEAFSQADPDRSPLYRDNAADYAGKLRDLDRRFQAALETCRLKVLVVGGHAAFGHLAARYGLEQVTLYGLSPDSEPSPRHLAEVIRLVRERGVRTIFFEELVSDRLARVVSSETGATLLPLNPGGNLTLRQRQEGTTFLSLMEGNLEHLRKGLACE